MHIGWTFTSVRKLGEMLFQFFKVFSDISFCKNYEQRKAGKLLGKGYTKLKRTMFDSASLSIDKKYV